MKIGYARVSTGDQNPGQQETILRSHGAERVYTDHGASGSKASRPQWDKCLDHLREGDTLLITRLDRAGRSLRHLVNLAADLQDRGVDLVVTEQSIDTSTATGRLLFHILAALAEFEMELNHERTREGLALARAQGRNGGPKEKLTPQQKDIAKRLHGTMAVNAIAKQLGVSRATLYRALAET